MNSRPVPLEHIVSTEFEGGEGVLVDLNHKRYYQLNETAMLVWRCIEKGLAPPEIIKEITDAYDVSDDHASSSFSKLLVSLQDHNLIRPSA